MERALRFAGLGALAGAYWLPGAAAVNPGTARWFGIPTRAPAGTGVILTFDDGPHPLGTRAILDTLARTEALATFFLSGEQVARHPELACEIAACGHDLGLHGYRHQTRRQWTTKLLATDTRRAFEAVYQATGRTPRLYRPPHGIFSIAGLRTVREHGLEPLLWSRWGRDWEKRATASSITRLATARITARDIILLHDADHYSAPGSWRQTAEALPRILSSIHQLGLTTGRYVQPATK